jgi:hypothetical protein
VFAVSYPVILFRKYTQNKNRHAFNQMPQLAKLPTNGKPQKTKIR